MLVTFGGSFYNSARESVTFSKSVVSLHIKKTSALGEGILINMKFRVLAQVHN